MSESGPEIFMMINVGQFDPKNKVKNMIKNALPCTSGIHKWKSREEMEDADNMQEENPVTYISRCVFH